MEREVKLQYRVVDVVRETPTILTLILENSEGDLPSYIAGQYITIYFPDLSAFQGKAYTISSVPSSEHISISVKMIGQFSNRLCAMKAGDMITGSLPYGYFYSESFDAPLVMIAGGIGIAPFRSMIIEAVTKGSSRKILLFYSIRTLEDAAFKRELDDLETSHEELSIRYFVTREQINISSVTQARITAKEIVDTVLAAALNIQTTEFFICGSILFARDLWRGLRANGVPEEMICTEAFFSH